MILAAGALMLLSPPVIGPENVYQAGPCYESFIAVAEQQRRVYLDPRDEIRHDATVRAIDLALRPLRSFEVMDRPGMHCVKGVVSQIDWFADTAVLQPVASYLSETYAGYSKLPLWPVSEQWTFAPIPAPSRTEFANGLGVNDSVGRRDGKGRVKAVAAAALDRARQACSTATPPPAGTPACGTAQIEELARADDPLARARFLPAGKARVRHGALPAEVTEELLAAALWIDLRSSTPDRYRFHETALDPPKEFADFYGEDAVWKVQAWALDEMLGDMDPSTWDLNDVAIIARKARAQDALPSEPISTSPKDVCSNAYLRALFPMGVVRAYTLVKPVRCKIAGVNIPYVAALSPASSGQIQVGNSPRWSHFPLEALLVDHEWRIAHPRVPLPTQPPAWDVQRPNYPVATNELPNEGFDKQNYLTQRWFELDEWAPQPKWPRPPSTYGVELPPEAQRLLDGKK